MQYVMVVEKIAEAGMSEEMQEFDYWQRTRNIHAEYKDSYRIFSGIMLVLVGIWIGSLIFSTDTGYATNLYTEFISILITVSILNFLNRLQDDKRRTQTLQDRLILEAGSTSNETAKNAIHQLKKKGWLVSEDGLLRGQDLQKADLQGADFQCSEFTFMELGRGSSQRIKSANLRDTIFMMANLSGADLQSADLRRSYLHLANLEEALLFHTNLQEADLSNANLRNAKLWNTNLQDASLFRANLRGTDLHNTVLVGADLTEARFDETTILPDDIPWDDEKRSYWTPDTDMARFTNSDHPKFWQSPMASSYQITARWPESKRRPTPR